MPSFKERLSGAVETMKKEAPEAAKQQALTTVLGIIGVILGGPIGQQFFEGIPEVIKSIKDSKKKPSSK